MNVYQLTCQSVIHVEAKALNLLHGQASVDKDSGANKRRQNVLVLPATTGEHQVKRAEQWD